jgi:Domain of unknown function (DUF397)
MSFCKGGRLPDGEEPLRWLKSSFSGTQDCLEWAISGDGVHLRNTATQSRVELLLTLAEWNAFLAGVKAGEADPPR